MRLNTIISGGQTGVDRAALDIAIELNISHGGYCPLGRKAEDGIIPMKYKLIELESALYADRTMKNVVSSDGTLILHSGIITNGTTLTKEFCIKENKPLIIINIFDVSKTSRLNFSDWLKENSINILNVAGQRESEKGNYEIAKQVLYQLLME